MIKEIRASGLMIGIELGAPSARMARLNWRLIHMASEGLFPQLIVIPLHRDHGVITMAAGKNDVIKLLPPLTLSEGEARSFLGALDAVLAECHGSSSKNLAVVRDIATTTLRRRARTKPPVSEQTPFRGKPVDPSREDVCLVTGATGFIGGRLARATGAGGPFGALPRAREQRHVAARGARRPARRRRPHRARARSLAPWRAVATCSTAARWYRTGPPRRRSPASTSQARGICSRPSVGASVRRFVHFSTTDVYGHPDGAAIDETYTATRFRNWYAQTKLDAEAEVRRVEEAAALDAVILRPATVYGPGSTDVIGEIARAIQGRHMLLIDGGRAVAGLCYVENLIDAAVLALGHEAAPGHAFNVSDGLDVTWKEFTDDLAEGLGCSKVRWSLPYWLASGVGFSLEHGYRLLRRTHRPERAAPALASSRAGAGQRPGLQQSQAARDARLGAARRLRAASRRRSPGCARSTLNPRSAPARLADVELAEVTLVLITGATRGIGQAAAVEIARQGAEVALVGRDAARVQDVAREAQGGRRRRAGPRARRRPDADGRRASARRGGEGALRAHRRAGQQRGRAVQLAQGDLRGLRAHVRAEPPGAVPADQPAARPPRRRARRDDRIRRPHVGAPGPRGPAVGARLRRDARVRHLEAVQHPLHPRARQARAGAARQLLSPRRRAHRLRQERERDLEGPDDARLPFFRTPARGARSLVWLALSEQAAALTGEYVQDEKVLAPSAQAQDATLAEGLWERSAELVGLSAGAPA